MVWCLEFLHLMGCQNARMRAGRGEGGGVGACDGARTLACVRASEHITLSPAVVCCVDC